MDPQGRYRVKFNFDLKAWKSGTESLWLRLAKPYAGNAYGFHFPLIDGTEVAIAFMQGNPDRPYVAHAMHDSVPPPLTNTAMSFAPPPITNYAWMINVGKSISNWLLNTAKANLILVT
ncbi:phage baseplate assembly protein V [Gilliamella sp. BG7]|uniref:phage baseplate assembly protein V n=1 Tax=unclassified Gilliamella TaxID=2685620 RepID=UPI003987FF05